MKMLDGMPPLEYIFSVEKIIRLVSSVINLNLGLSLTEDDVEKAKTVEEKYSAIFTKKNLLRFLPNPLNFVPLPTYTHQHWEEDKEHARQFLCGVNPVMINVVTDVDAQISKPLTNFFGRDQLKELAQSKRLFFVSYDDIDKLKEQASYKNPHMSYPLNTKPLPQPDRKNEKRFFHAPIALFSLDEARVELDIIGIQLDREPDAKVYTRNSSPPDEWLFVKSCLIGADSQMHEVSDSLFLCKRQHNKTRTH